MSRNFLTVIFSSAGRRVGLIECFRNAALDLGIGLRVISCDMSPALSSACHRADVCFKAPDAMDASFIPAMRKIAMRESADLIIPTIDTELGQWAAASRDFSTFGCRIHVSSSEVINIVRDKFMTMSILSRANVPVPATYRFEDLSAAPHAYAWPMFMKPSSGSASRLVRLVCSPGDLPEAVTEPMILQDYLSGPEYTVNAFVDASGALRSVVTHRRIQIRAGEVEKGVTERHPSHLAFARGILKALPGLRGAFCFQVIDDLSSGPKVIEINARFGGGYPLIDHAGATYAKWLLEDAAGLPSTASDRWQDGITMLRYDAAVFLGHPP